MELIKGNWFVVVTILANFVFAWSWAMLSNGPFERVFSFLRQKNRRKQLKLGVKLILGISIACYVVYGIGCLIFGISLVSIAGLLLPVFLMVCTLFRLSGSAAGKDAMAVLKDSFALVIVPNIIGVVVLTKRVRLDEYCDYVAFFMVFMMIWAVVRDTRIWRKGDI